DGDAAVQWRQVEATGDAAGRTYVVVADPGDEAFRVLSDFAADRGLSAAQLTAVGAFRSATVGWFDRDARDYRHIEIGEQCEVLSLIGDVALGEDGPAVHAHAVLGLA